MAAALPPHTEKPRSPDRSVADGVPVLRPLPGWLRACEREMPCSAATRPATRSPATCMAEPGRVPGIGPLLAAYADGSRTPRACSRVYATLEPRATTSMIHVLPLETRSGSLRRRRSGAAAGAALPLSACRFAIKDNIDVAGHPTHRGGARRSRTSRRPPPRSCPVAEAGAILVGKTNLDQFATGLTATRSPYGALSSVFDPDYVAGGSSSGSAVAVAARFGALRARHRHRGPPDACRRPSTASWAQAPRVGSSARRA